MTSASLAATIWKGSRDFIKERLVEINMIRAYS